MADENVLITRVLTDPHTTKSMADLTGAQYSFMWGSDYTAVPQREAESSVSEFLLKEVSVLRLQIEKQSALIRELIEGREPSEQLREESETVELLEVNNEQAREMILGLFAEADSERPLYYSDVAEHLKIDLRLVVEICNALVEEGRLELDDSA